RRTGRSHRKVAVRTDRQGVPGRRAPLANDKGTGSQRADRRKALDSFTEDLLADTGARAALERLEAAGISRQMASAFLYITTSCPDHILKRDLPRPEHLRATAAHIYGIAKEISAFNRNANLSLLKQHPVL